MLSRTTVLRERFWRLSISVPITSFAPPAHDGTLRGCSEFFRLHSPSTKIVAVDAVGSVIFGGTKGPRLIPGHATELVPLCTVLISLLCAFIVTDRECVIGCRRLMAEELILMGGSSGAVLMALEKIRNDLHQGALAVKNPRMIGGPFIDLQGGRVDEIRALRDRIRKERAHLLELSSAIGVLDAILRDSAKGYGLQSLYPRAPDILRGYVETRVRPE